MGIIKRTNIAFENGIETDGMLNIPTPISKRLRMIKTLSTLVFLLFLKSFHSNVPFETAIANAVIIKKYLQH